MRRYAARSVLVVLLCCAGAGTAAGSDTAPGADADWLPNEEWVLEHWIPYDQRRLTRLLHTDMTGLRDWMRGDRPLAGLARRRGLMPSRLARRLVAPWRGRVSRRHHQALYRRALKTLTQGHLALHLFFHPTHSRSLNRLYVRLHAGHSESVHSPRSLMEIAEAKGRSAAWLQRKALRLVRGSARRGVRLQATSRGQARRWLQYQEPAVLGWLEWRPR
jgi:hypothetical protein